MLQTLVGIKPGKTVLFIFVFSVVAACLRHKPRKCLLLINKNIGFWFSCAVKISVFKSLDNEPKKNFEIFLNYVPTVLVFSRTSAIECKKRFFEIRPGTRFFLVISIFVSMGQYMDENRNKKKKACSRSNFEKRFFAFNCWGSEEYYYSGNIIWKKIWKLFYGPDYKSVIKQSLQFSPIFRNWSTKLSGQIHFWSISE